MSDIKTKPSKSKSVDKKQLSVDKNQHEQSGNKKTPTTPRERKENENSVDKKQGVQLNDKETNNSALEEEKETQEQTTQQESTMQEGIFDQDTTFRKLGVCEEICEALDRLKFKHPTKIQAESLPYTLKGQDIIGLAETGSGKTLSFAIPIVQALLDSPQPFFACIMAPTRELSVQIAEQFEAIGAGIALKCCVIVGGLDPMAQAIALSKKPHIIIGTPGRLLYHLENTKGFNLKNLKFLVMDEADKLLNMDFEREINMILENIPKQRNTFLFSATMTNKVGKLQRASLTNPVKIEVSSKYQTVSTLVQNYIFIPAKYKECYLVYLLTEFSGNSIIIFINTCLNAIKMTLMLRNLGFQAIAIHGKLAQVKRLGALNKFKSQDKSILIATDVAARGLDIPSVDLVLNFDIPLHSKDYVHRVGRTARAGKSGRSITFVTQYDVESYQKIEHLIDKKLDVYPCEESEVLVFNERVEEAARIAAQELKDLLDRKKKKGLDDDSDDEGDGKKKKKPHQNNQRFDKKGGHGKREKNQNKRIKFDI